MEAIGIVGGVGPYAGLDLNKKIFDNINGINDQDYPEVYLVSACNKIPDRSTYVLQKSSTNPSIEIFNAIKKLYNIGAKAIGIPCNTAHSSIILDDIHDKIQKNNMSIKLLNIVEECCKFILDMNNQRNITIGLLSTKGTYGSNLYGEYVKRFSNIELLVPNDSFKDIVHDAIYDTSYGVKSFSNPIKKKAKESFINVANDLIKNGADVIIAGCTEIPLALTNQDISKTLIDPTNILAQALIREAKCYAY